MDDTLITDSNDVAIMPQQQVTSIGRKPISTALLEERRQHTAALKLAGMSYQTIVKDVNNRSKVKGWGEVTLLTVIRDISAYYRANKVVDLEDYDYYDNLRTAHIHQIEKVIEKMSLHVYDKKYKWKPFEYMAALTELHKAQVNLTEIQNWHLGNKNPQSVVLETNHITQIFDKAAMDLNFTPKPVIEELNNLFEESISKIEDDPELVVSNSINDV